MNPNIYEQTARAMNLQDSIPCGPDGETCDLNFHCAAHGGDRRDDDGWTPAHESALKNFETGWSQVTS